MPSAVHPMLPALALAMLIAGPVPVARAQVAAPASRAQVEAAAMQAAAAQAPPAGPQRALSLVDAVQMALEQNADLQVERIAPQLQDESIAATKAAWTPSLSSAYTGTSQSTQPNNFLVGGTAKVIDRRNSLNVGLGSLLPWGGTYNVTFTNQRGTTNNLFTLFNPQLSTTLQGQYQQSLLRNFRIDQTRQQLLVSRKTREISDVQLKQAVALTSRSVRNAYWDLVGALDNLAVQKQSLELAQRSLRDNRARVEIGTMAPIDVVQAEAEVAQREESVIVAEAAIGRAEDRLRALIYGEHVTDQWSTRLVPTDRAAFTPVSVDVDAAVTGALDGRADVAAARKTLEANDVSIRFLRNQILPDLTANVSYNAAAVGGTRFIRGPGFPGDVIGTTERPWNDVVADVLRSQYPTWTLTVQFSYPLGRATAEANLARARLQTSQTQKQLDALRIRVATEVREAGRQVTANAKRVDATRASRALAEKRLESEEKKYQAGMSTNFLVFQAQRDLNQARNNELQALIDYLKSTVDYETVQQAPLSGAGAGVSSIAGVSAGPSSALQLGAQQGAAGTFGRQQ